MEEKTRKRYPKLHSIDDEPEIKGQLTFDWMIEYLQEKGTPEQCNKMLDYIKNNQIERKNNFNNGKKTYITTDIKGMRDLFCEWFFPYLQETKTANSENQLERAQKLLSKKASRVNKRRN